AGPPAPAPAAGPEGPVPVGRGRPRQDLPDRPVPRRTAVCRRRRQAPHPLPSLHARGPRPVARACGRGRSAEAHRRALARPAAGAGAGRVLRQRHRGRDVAGAPAGAAVRRRRRAGDDVQHRTFRAVQGRAAARALPAGHRPAPEALPGAVPGQRARLPAAHTDPLARVPGPAGRGRPGLAGGPLIVDDRPIPARGLAPGHAWFDFGALCEGPRAAGDYIEIATEYHTVLLGGIPRMDGSNDDPARRFVHLVDELYDRQVNLVCTAAAAPPGLYTGSRLVGAFERTASRLIEMQSAEYLALPHRG